MGLLDLQKYYLWHGSNVLLVWSSMHSQEDKGYKNVTCYPMLDTSLYIETTTSVPTCDHTCYDYFSW